MAAYAYYNELDPYAAVWLRNLIAEGLIAPGDVDERDVREVHPGDLHGYRQCHLFAGLADGVTRSGLAGWPDDRPVWTGSCPCQPLSSAGRRQGHADRRHLWPAFCRLIAECTPAVVFGEQVASRLGREWLAGVRVDLEHWDMPAGCRSAGCVLWGAAHPTTALVRCPSAGRRRMRGRTTRRTPSGVFAGRNPRRSTGTTASV